jgi:hypothetical protein
LGHFYLRSKMAENENKGIPIPDVIDPPESMEMTLCIPKNRDHMAAFFGALYSLTEWNSWQQDGTTHGKELAAVWWRYFLSWDRTMNDIDCEDGMGKCCVEPVIIKRINPDTGRPETSTDGGVTWTPDPTDTQNQIQLMPPIVGDGSDRTKCDAATNASEHINDLIAGVKTNLETASTVFVLAEAIAEAALAIFVVIVSGGTLSPLVAALMAAIWGATVSVFALGVEGYDAYWTSDKKDAILCKLYCNIGENGQFTETQYQNFRSQIKATLPASPAFDIVMTTINAGGATGLSQMASYGNAALADCSACGCGDCASHWSLFPDYIAAGQTLIHGDGYVQADGWLAAGQYWVIIKTNDPSQCCHVDGAEIISGSVSGHGYTDCNNPFNEYAPQYNPALGYGECINYIYMYSSAPFTVKFTFSECA